MTWWGFVLSLLVVVFAYAGGVARGMGLAKRIDRMIDADREASKLRP